MSSYATVYEQSCRVHMESSNLLSYSFYICLQVHAGKSAKHYGRTVMQQSMVEIYGVEKEHCQKKWNCNSA